jgi:dipeptidyl aminopeptidase/acylaminoacyl peptidase
LTGIWRSLRLLFLTLPLLLGCDPGADSIDIPAANPGMEPSDEGYAAARARFQTRLVREGPASPVGQLPPTPEGAVAVTYRSGSLTLRAFASPETTDGNRRPAVLFMHGGFEFGEGHWLMTRPFRDAGYVVMVPTLRGENGQPGSFSFFFDEVDDVLAAADRLAGRPDVDPDRLFVAGHSVGGTMAMLAALASPRFRAAASFSGSPDQVEFTRGRTGRIPFDLANRDEFRLRSPVVFAQHFQCPVRLYHGEDEFWLQSPTRRTVGLARRAGLDVKDVEVEGGHETANPEVIKACLAFFRNR